jgi:nicotinamidase-related amidase
MTRLSLCVIVSTFIASTVSAATLDLRLRRLVKIAPGEDEWKSIETRVEWDPSRTAAVICDMWDRHWCKGAAARVKEMAPRMNELVWELRTHGVLIIHCPSDTMKFYEGTEGRKLAQSAPKAVLKVPVTGWCPPDATVEPPLPIDGSDGGCDDVPKCPSSAPWSHEIETLEIQAGDAITDSVEAFNLMHHRGITNVIIMGVHQNMCVLGRPFGIRQTVRQGQNVVLVRDLTDSMYNSRRLPFVDHFAGSELVTWHIEKYWCGTITSDQILGGKSFRFADDTKPRPVFHNFSNQPAPKPSNQPPAR